MDLTELPFGLPGRVYRSPMPFSLYDRNAELLKSYLERQVSVVVQLVSDEEGLQRSGHNLRSLYAQNGVEVLYLPVPDFGVPPPGMLEEVLETALNKVKAAENLVVHCNAGIGRTGLFLACLAKRALGLDGEQAVQWVRRYVPGAVEVPEQINFVKNYRYGVDQRSSASI